MLKIEQIREIRELKLNENLSNSKIAEIVGVSRSSVAKALVCSVQLEDMHPHRKSPYNRSPSKLFLPYVKELLAQSQSEGQSISTYLLSLAMNKISSRTSCNAVCVRGQ